MRVLIVDDFSEMRELLEFILSAEMGLNTVTASSGNEAIEKLRKGEVFSLIISDLNMPNGNGADLFRHHQQTNLDCPFVLMSGDKKEQHPELKGAHLHWMLKPFEVSDMISRLSSLLQQAAPAQDSYVPVALSLLKRMKQIDVPLFVRINEKKYVKMTMGPSDFTAEEDERYRHRGLRYLYIESSHADAFIAAYRKKVLSLLAWQEANSDDHEMISLNIELLKNMSDLLGWESQVVDLAKQAIMKTLHLIRTQPKIQSILNQFHKIERYGFSDHCTVSLLISTGLLKIMNYEDETSLAKVTFASVLHDMTLTDDQYQHKSKLVSQLLNGQNTSKDSHLVFEHPWRAAELCQGWDFCPPETDLIIRSHHERPDGTGFPLGLKSSEMDFMSSLFIISEDFSDYFLEAFGKPDLIRYLETRRSVFSSGHFKSIFRALESAILMQEKSAA